LGSLDYKGKGSEGKTTLSSWRFTLTGKRTAKFGGGRGADKKEKGVPSSGQKTNYAGKCVGGKKLRKFPKGPGS